MSLVFAFRKLVCCLWGENALNWARRGEEEEEEAQGLSCAVGGAPGSLLASLAVLLERVLVRLLHDRQLGVVVLHRQVLVRLLLRAVNHQRPLLDEARLRSGTRVPHLQLPDAARILAPGVGGHEGPLDEAIVVVVVIGPSAQNH